MNILSLNIKNLFLISVFDWEISLFSVLCMYLFVYNYKDNRVHVVLLNGALKKVRLISIWHFLYSYKCWGLVEMTSIWGVVVDWIVLRVGDYRLNWLVHGCCSWLNCFESLVIGWIDLFMGVAVGWIILRVGDWLNWLVHGCCSWLNCLESWWLVELTCSWVLQLVELFWEFGDWLNWPTNQ